MPPSMRQETQEQDAPPSAELLDFQSVTADVQVAPEAVGDLGASQSGAADVEVAPAAGGDWKAPTSRTADIQAAPDVVGCPKGPTCSTSTVRQYLERLESGKTLSTDEIEREFGAIIFYKNRYLDGFLLHYAVWVSSQRHDPTAGPVRLALQSGADVHSCARYRKENQFVTLEAIHIAAGLGCVAAMQALLDSQPTAEAKLQLVNCECRFKGVYFYAPIHDAAFCGRKDAVVWLLESGADATRANMDGLTPLHWLAYKGLDAVGDLEVVVRALVKHGARLDERTHDKKAEIQDPSSHTTKPGATVSGRIKKGMRGRMAKGTFNKKKNRIEGTPLEIAAMPGSQFPNKLMHLLAPSIHSYTDEAASRPHSLREEAVKHCSVFDDIVLLCSRNMKAAQDLALDIARSDAGDPVAKTLLDSQQRGAVERMASVLMVAPQAAVDLFSITFQKPHIKDPGHHPLISRASLWRGLQRQPMICTYQPDEDYMKLASMFGGRLQSPSLMEERLEWPTWSFDPSESRGSQFPQWHSSFVHVSDERHNEEVVTKVSLMPNIMNLDIFKALGALPTGSSTLSSVYAQAIIYCAWQELIFPVYAMSLAFQLVDLSAISIWGLASHPEVGGNSVAERPLMWSVILAGLLRDVVNLAWWCAEHCRKWRAHKLDEADEAARLLDLDALWHPLGFLGLVLFLDLAFFALKAGLLLDVQLDLLSGREDTLLTDNQQACLALAFMGQSLKALYMFRLTSGSGQRIFTILKTLTSPAMLEIVAVMAVIFLLIAGTFIIVHKGKDAGWVITHVYVGLSFGDSGNLGHFGLDPDTQDSLHWVETVTTYCVSAVFNIVLMNLLIAIFANEYDKIEKHADVLFQRERARYCSMCFLSLQKVHIREDEGALRLRALRATIWAALTLCVLLYLISRHVVCLVFMAILLALAQVIMQAMLMQTDWFSQRSDGSTGPKQDHFLWVCHPTSLEESAVDAECGGGIDELSKQISEIRSHLQGQDDNRLKLDAIIAHLGVVLPTMPQEKGSDVRTSAGKHGEREAVGGASPQKQRRTLKKVAPSSATE